MTKQKTRANTDAEERLCSLEVNQPGKTLLLCGSGVGVVKLGWRCSTDGGEASEKGGAGELRWARPAGEVEGRGGVGRGGFVGGVVLHEFVEDEGAHAGLLFNGGAFPVEAEALATNMAFHILSVVGFPK